MEPVLLCGKPPVRDLGFGRGDLGGRPLGSSGSNPVGPPGPHLTEFDLSSIGDLPSPEPAPLVLLDLLMGVRTSNKPELDSSAAVAADSLSSSSFSSAMLTGLLPLETPVFSAAPDPSLGHKDPSVTVPVSFSGGGA